MTGPRRHRRPARTPPAGSTYKSLRLAQALGDRLEMSFEVQGIAMSLAGRGEAERAVRLAGAVQGEWERMGVDLHTRFWDALLHQYIGSARQALGPERADAVWNEGRVVSFDDAMTLALVAD